MENGIMITLGLLIGYFLFKFIYKRQKNVINTGSEHAQKSTVSDILTNDKYKVKGQWDK